MGKEVSVPRGREEGLKPGGWHFLSTYSDSLAVWSSGGRFELRASLQVDRQRHQRDQNI